ncbi:outer membrane protein assembly factor BamB [Bowmanella dokdonensis]|uniref:Outer membrane protein assembly factor BamB n=1 Tax=Bowmanella dokdonensis TaxID=751969 RepID=A0A939DPS5_9ALTE|nr:outer membrane protein assembly factor BamB [Bowmanella dokdonensis]MBN7826418.1 outer membrane protein assembly factor BamB [Bowmanella dokdonensis]
MVRNSVRALCLFSLLGLSGCSILPQWMDPTTWFIEEEELKIKELQPIEPLFTPKVIWEEEVGEGVGEHFSRLRPAVAYDKVFAADRHGQIKAFDKTSGKVIWEQNFALFGEQAWWSGVSRLWQKGASARIAGGLVAAYDSLYFGTENGDVYALNAETGETRWHTKVKGEVLARPAVSDGLVIINTGAGVMFALDAETGEQQWLYESEVPPLSLRGISAPTVNSGGAIVGTASGKVAIVIMENGQIAWEQAVTAASGATELDRIVDIDVEPLVLGGVIYVISFDGSLAALELRSGRTIWKREYKSYRRISLDANNLYVVSTESQVFALDRRNGVELWSQNTLRSRQLTEAEPLGSYLVVGDKYGYLHWLSQADGKIVARLEVGDNDLDEGIYAAPVVDGKVLYTQTRDGQLKAIETP